MVSLDQSSMRVHSNPDHNQGIAPRSVDEGMDRSSKCGQLAGFEGFEITTYSTEN
jgi:hypothetical protein